MPKAKTEGKSEKFELLRKDAASFHETNDCSVKALALVAGIPYAEAHFLMQQVGRKNRRGVSCMAIRRALKLMNFKVTLVSRRDILLRYPGSHKFALKNVTTHHPERFPSVWKDGKTYLLRTTGHVCAVIDGVNHDWTRGKACRVWQILQVEKQ